MPGKLNECDNARQWHVIALDDEGSLSVAAVCVILGIGIAEVKRVWISKEARGRGSATIIMDWLEAKADAEGFSAIRLDTNRTLNEAQALYRKRGYREIKRYNRNPFARSFL